MYNETIKTLKNINAVVSMNSKVTSAFQSKVQSSRNSVYSGGDIGNFDNTDGENIY